MGNFRFQKFKSDSMHSVRFSSVRFNSVRFSLVRFNSVRFNSVQFKTESIHSVRFNAFNPIQSIQFDSKFGLICWTQSSSIDPSKIASFFKSIQILTQKVITDYLVNTVDYLVNTVDFLVNFMFRSKHVKFEPIWFSNRPKRHRIDFLGNPRIFGQLQK